MPLTTEQITEIIKGVDTTPVVGESEKRRRAPRIKHRDNVVVVPYSEDTKPVEQRAIMVDFSSRGVGIRFGKGMPLGTHVVLVLPHGNNAVLRLLCTVANCRPRSEGDFFIGCEFIGLAPAANSKTMGQAEEIEVQRIASMMF